MKAVQKEQGRDFIFRGEKPGYRRLPRPGFGASHTVNSPSSRLWAPVAPLTPASRGAPSSSPAVPPPPPSTDPREASAVLCRPGPGKQRGEGGPALCSLECPCGPATCSQVRDGCPPAPTVSQQLGLNCRILAELSHRWWRVPGSVPKFELCDKVLSLLFGQSDPGKRGLCVNSKSLSAVGTSRKK